MLRVLRKVFGLKRGEVTGEWRKLHNEELNDLYSLPSIVRVVKSRRMRRAGHVARMEEDSGVHRVLVGKPEGKMPLGIPRRRWEYNIKMDEVTGELRMLHNEELNDLYSLPSIVRVVKSRRMRWAGHVARMQEDRGVHRVLVGKPEAKRSLR